MNINEIKEGKFKKKNWIYSIFFPRAKGGKLQEFKIPCLWFLRQQNTFHFNRGGLKSGNYKAKSATLTTKKKNHICLISKHLKRFPMKTLRFPQTFPDWDHHHLTSRDSADLMSLQEEGGRKSSEPWGLALLWDRHEWNQLTDSVQLLFEPLSLYLWLMKIVQTVRIATGKMKKEKVLILGYISFQTAKVSSSSGFDSSLPKPKGSSPPFLLMGNFCPLGAPCPLAWILTGTPSSRLNRRGRTLPTASTFIS